MLKRLANHNADINRLLEKGYALAIDSNYLVIRDVPYLDSKAQLQIGAIVTKLEYIDKEHVRLHNHQICFAGSSPCNLDGSKIRNLGDQPKQLNLSGASRDVQVQRIFSNKPKSGTFLDFYDKIESYVSIISAPAMERFKVSPYTFREFEDSHEESVFLFRDTLTSRAEITDLSKKFANDVVAIIGGGGTGAYILDFIVKTPIKEIRVFDFDHYYVHNAFRSPGRVEENDFGKPKAEVLSSRYENFRKGVKAVPIFLNSTSKTELKGVTFAFVCVDKGSSRSEIFELLIELGIPFIDVGMGLDRKNGPINGLIRTTYYSSQNGRKVLDEDLAPMTDTKDDIYKNNIQIAELNALNASLAVIKFKQLRGFYYEEEPIYHHAFEIGDLSVGSEKETA